ncbi:hypothetical protein BDZ89DRAFT_911077, partial [Hymenopellis radicata]
TNWDPILLISQIISLQTLHYLTLSLLVPPLLAIFAEPSSLNYEGGAANVGMVMDWREMAGRSTIRGIGDRWDQYSWVWSGGMKVGTDREGAMIGVDQVRGWIIAFCWMVACASDIYYIYTIVRRPRMVLDFALSLVFIHLVLTTYYSASIPTSLFFWLVVGVGALATVVMAEQLCVRREMQEGLSVVSTEPPEEED